MGVMIFQCSSTMPHILTLSIHGTMPPSQIDATLQTSLQAHATGTTRHQTPN